MRTKQTAPETVDAYIAGFPDKVQKILEKIRKTIRKAAPDAGETISYQIPAYKLHGVLVYFAAHQKHIGLYPAPRGRAEFKEELAGYAGGKGTVQFPLDKPIPYDLISRIVKFRAAENRAKAAAKVKKK
ncbi:MAG: iron chaperone [Blastocatellia bacterium]